MTLRLGVVLPTFTSDPAGALAAGRDAEASGLHGVFAYDHLWPMGQPGRPALSPGPILGAVAAITARIAIGTLVARVGLRPDAVLIAELLSLDATSGGRLIAGMGTGDAKSAAENLAYGVGFPPASERRRRLGRIATELLASGVPVWIGGGSPATDEVARATGAVLNLWSVAPEVVLEAAGEGPVSWGGLLPKDGDSAAELLVALDQAGATWAVLNWPGSCAAVVSAASAAGIALG